MNNQEHLYSEFNANSYKRLIDIWLKKEIKKSDFKYEGEVIGEKTLSTLFFEQILKKTLSRICFLLGDGANSIGNKTEVNSITKTLGPIINSATKSDYPKTPITDMDLSIVRKLPITFFSSWLVLTLERDVLPYKGKLEFTFSSEVI